MLGTSTLQPDRLGFKSKLFRSLADIAEPRSSHLSNGDENSFLTNLSGGLSFICMIIDASTMWIVRDCDGQVQEVLEQLRLQCHSQWSMTMETLTFCSCLQVPSLLVS